MLNPVLMQGVTSYFKAKQQEAAAMLQLLFSTPSNAYNSVSLLENVQKWTIALSDASKSLEVLEKYGISDLESYGFNTDDVDIDDFETDYVDDVDDVYADDLTDTNEYSAPNENPLAELQENNIEKINIKDLDFENSEY